MASKESGSSCTSQKYIFQDPYEFATHDVVRIPPNIVAEHMLCHKESISSLRELLSGVRAVLAETSPVSCLAHYLIVMHRHSF